MAYKIGPLNSSFRVSHHLFIETSRMHALPPHHPLFLAMAGEIKRRIGSDMYFVFVFVWW